MTGTVLILGADGFIGRHLAFGLRQQGWDVIASARRTNRLEQMGFETLRADLTAPNGWDPEYWRPQLKHVTHLVNAAGVLNAPGRIFEAVHVTTPEAIYKALPATATGLLISAVGIDAAPTDFARFRREGEATATRHNITILRAGLVLGDTSYGGSSLMRALAAFPLITPVVGTGNQAFNPIHAADLTHAVSHLLRHSPPPGPHEIGGPENITQTDMLRGLRGWLGLRPVRVIKLPVKLAYLLGRAGDFMRLGPISRNAVAQLETSILARPDAAMASLPTQPRGFSGFINTRPAGTQDLWHARAYLMRPVLRLVLAFMWVTSGLIGLLLPTDQFIPLMENTGFNETLLTTLARLGGLADLAIAAALIRGWHPRLMAGIQAAMVLGYTAAFTITSPALWLLPLGGLLKNLPVLALIAMLAILEDER